VAVQDTDFVADSEGDAETKLRGIDAPEEGESYVDSYYSLLEAIEKNTVYVAESQEELPDASTVGSEYDSLLGLTETEVSDSEITDSLDHPTVHVHNGSEWVDTFDTVNTVINHKITELDNDISDEIGSVPDGKTVQGQIHSLKEVIGDAEDLEAVERTVNESNLKSEHDIDELERKADHTYGVIGDAFDLEEVEHIVRGSNLDEDHDIESLREDVNNIDATETIKGDVRNSRFSVKRFSGPVEEEGREIIDLTDEVSGFSSDSTLLSVSARWRSGHDEPIPQVAHAAAYLDEWTSDAQSFNDVTFDYICRSDGDMNLNGHILYLG